MDLTGKRILVIGGAGLIGSHVVEALVDKEVAEVVIFDDFSRGSRENLTSAMVDPRVRIFEAGGDITRVDLLNAAVDGMDGVYLLAALWLLQCHEYPRAAFEVNVGGTFNVIEACLRHEVSRLVFSSSASVYGDAVEEPMTEDHPFNNKTFYGATKICGESLLHACHERYGLDYVGLRYMNVYGARQDYRGAYVAVIMKMLDAIDNAQPLVVYGDGTQAYDFIDASDCAVANIKAMQAQTSDQYYNIGSGVRTTILELAELLVEITGSRAGIRFEPEGTTFVKNRIGSTTKAARDLGFTTSIPLADGLKRLIDWRAAHRQELEARHARGATP